MGKEPLVSIIVPVYNREKTIQACIKSILDSEMMDFEVLLIDDGSTDATGKVCEQLAAHDKRVICVRKVNEGVSVARNVGLTMAKGIWITFVDSDDAILPCHLNVLLQKQVDSVDLIMTDHVSGNVKNGKVIPSHGNIGSIQDVVVSSNATAYLFNDFKPFKNPIYPIWNKFFKRSIISEKGILFDSTMSLGEDQVFLCEYLQYAKGLAHFKIKSFVNLAWSGLEHLGSKLRDPSDYLYNQKKNYKALCGIIKNGGGKTELYAINYGIDRPISRILYNYTKIQNRNVLSYEELKSFTKNEIIPFIRSISTKRFKPIDVNVRIVRFLLLYANVDVVLLYCRFYNVVHPLYAFVYRAARKLKRFIG